MRQSTKIWMDNIIKYEYDHQKTEYDFLYNKISNYLTENSNVAPLADAVAYNSKDIVKEVLPDIIEQQNEDGLIPLSILEPVLPGIYRQGDFLIFAHRYFRRNYSLLNTLNNDFLRRFDQLDLNRSGEFIWLAIDWDLIGLAGTEKEYCERAYSWGAPFNDDLSLIPDGVTTYINDKYDETFPGIKSTQFYWHVQGNKKRFECEEINMCPNISEESKIYNCRYIHSIVEERSNYFIHLDGAIRSYSEAEIKDRENKQVNHVGRNIPKTKLWRVDGSINISLWKELITAYYRDNTLIGEYLSGEDEYTKFKQAFKIN